MNAAVTEAAVTEVSPLRRLARRLHELPPWPRALAEAQRAAARDDLCTSACVQAVEQDPALAARVVRLANAPFYGAPGRIASVAEAVRFLGLRTVVGVLAAVCLRGLLAARLPAGFDFEAHWRRALVTAVVARELARPAGQAPDEAFLAGLLHDVGRLVLAVLGPDDAGAMAGHDAGRPLPDQSAGPTAVAAPGEGLAAALGAEVARHWHFPDDIVRAIDGHGQPPGPDAAACRSLAALVRTGAALADAHALGLGPPQALGLLDAEIRTALRIDVLQVEQLLAGIDRGLADLLAA